MAYYAKKISAVEYLQYGDWLKHVRETVEAESIEHAVHERTYCGFSYLDERGNIKYYHNAVKASALERQSELRKKKQLVTPMVAKRYCFNKVEMFDGVIEDFKNVLHKTYNEAYWNVLLQIYALPTMVDKNAFMKAYDAAIESGDKLLVDALQYYGVLWHVWELKRG